MVFLKKPHRRFNQYCGAKGQGALIQIEFRVVQWIIFVAFLLYSEQEHRTGCVWKSRRHSMSSSVNA